MLIAMWLHAVLIQTYLYMYGQQRKMMVNESMTMAATRMAEEKDK